MHSPPQSAKKTPFSRLSAAPLVIAGALLVVVAARAETPPQENRFNVLFIAIDDLRPELGCYGVTEAQSPNLDELARSSIVFQRHYVQVPTCGASRYALLTGRSPASSGVTRQNEAAYAGAAALNRQPQAGAQSMPELFRRSGYRTICLGKISHTPDGRVFAYNGQGDGREEIPHAWDELPTPLGGWKRGWGIFFAYSHGRHREDGYGHQDLMEFVAQQDDELPDGMIAATAIERLRALKAKGEKFFMGVGFFKPHLPFVATQADWEAFADVDLPVQDWPKVQSPSWSGSGEFYKYNAPYKKSNPLDDPAKRMARRAYYACVRYVDRQVGRVIDALRQEGLDKNTIVVVWGDHGWHLGEQQIWAKHTPLERANRSVLMIRVPGATRSGHTTALVETTDVYPTLVDLCQPTFQQTQWPLDGKSLRPILEDNAAAIRDAAISYWGDATSVRTDKYRLIVRPKKGKRLSEELYDLSVDPDSVRNLAASEPQTVQRLKRYLPQMTKN
jgi:arylsulfatase A-like enzyme